MRLVHRSNGKQDGIETDVDCGGGACLRCADGKVCGGASDCVSNRCSGNICVSCTDLTANKTGSRPTSTVAAAPASGAPTARCAGAHLTASATAAAGTYASRAPI